MQLGVMGGIVFYKRSNFVTNNISMRKVVLFTVAVFFSGMASAQVYAFENGNWLMGKRFVKKTVYTKNGLFVFDKPAAVDSVVNLAGKYCIPPFGDAHTHNLDGAYNLPQMIKQYVQEGIFYVQVMGNYGSGAQVARPILAKANVLEATYANALLTATYGHGFYPYEPMAMGFYNPADQFKYADSVKKSHLAENDAYCFLDSIADVDAKWPLIMKYHPNHIKICLLDAADYAAKRKAEKVETYGLSPEVADYVVKKAHAAGLRVFAHVETAADARLCAAIGVDALAHLPGYGWNGIAATKEKFCITPADVRLLKKAGITVIPTMNINHTDVYDDKGVATKYPERFRATLQYKKDILRALYKAKVPIALGADYYGKTVTVEIDSLISAGVFTNAELLDIYCVQTPQHIFPGRKLGTIAKDYEASFLVLNDNPLLRIQAVKSDILLRVKQGRMVAIKEK
jgi:imidazolonepropionase-like amidohydrolase